MPPRVDTSQARLNEGQFRGQNLFTRNPRVRVDDRGDRFLQALSGVTRELGRFAVERANERGIEEEEAGRRAALDPDEYHRAVEAGEIEAIDSPFFEAGFQDESGRNRARDVANQINQTLPETASLDDVNDAYLEARTEALQGNPSDFFVSAFDDQMRGQLTNTLNTQNARLRQQRTTAARGEIDRGVTDELRRVIADPQGTVDTLNLMMIKQGALGHSADTLAPIALKRFIQALELSGDRRVWAAAHAVRFNDGTTLGERHGLELAAALESGEARIDRESSRLATAETKERKQAADEATVAIAQGIESGQFQTAADVPEKFKAAAELHDPRFRTNTLPGMFDSDTGGADEAEFALFKSDARRGRLSRDTAMALLGASRISASQFDELVKITDGASDEGPDTLTQSPIFKANVTLLNKAIEVPGAGTGFASTKGAASIYEQQTELIAERALFDHLSRLEDQSPANLEKEARAFVKGVDEAVRQTQFPGIGAQKQQFEGPVNQLQSNIRKVAARLAEPEALAIAEREIGFEGATPEEDAVIVETLRAYAADPDNPPQALVAFAADNGTTLERAALALHMQRPN